MSVVLSVCNVVLLKSYHVLSLRSVILLQRRFVLSNCCVIVLKLCCSVDISKIPCLLSTRGFVAYEGYVILSIRNLKLSELHSILFV